MRMSTSIRCNNYSKELPVFSYYSPRTVNHFLFFFLIICPTGSSKHFRGFKVSTIENFYRIRKLLERVFRFPHKLRQDRDSLFGFSLIGTTESLTLLVAPSYGLVIPTFHVFHSLTNLELPEY